MVIIVKRTPIYKFAIREDLRDNPISFLPERAEPNASGWDVKAAQTTKLAIILSSGQYVKIPLGFRVFCPDGWWLELKPRSSTFAKKNLHCLYGTIDTDFEGQLLFAVQYIADPIINGGILEDRIIEFGEPIGQIIPVKRKEMFVQQVSNDFFDHLCKERNAKRGPGGFGSTDGKIK